MEKNPLRIFHEALAQCFLSMVLGSGISDAKPSGGGIFLKVRSSFDLIRVTLCCKVNFLPINFLLLQHFERFCQLPTGSTILWSSLETVKQSCVFSTQYKYIHPLEKSCFFRDTKIFTSFLGCSARNSRIICAMGCCIELIFQKVMVSFRIFIAGLAKYSAFLDFRN